MRFAIALFGLAALTSYVEAFTNGTLIPSYICGPQGDGYPKSAGTIIPYLQLGVGGDTFNQFPPGTGTTAITVNTAPSSQDIIGACHNGLPGQYTKTLTNPVWIAPYPSDPNTGLPITGGPGYVITPGKLHSFIIAVNCPINTNYTNANFGGCAGQNIAGYNNPNVALDGFMAYALDTATNQRIGSWVNVGTTLTNFSACNIGGQYSTSVGIVHNQLVTCNGNLANITWQAPATIKGTVKFIGVGVADCGYGPIAIQFNVSTTGSNVPGNGVGNWSAPSPVAQGLNSQTTANLAALGVTSLTAALATPAAALPQAVGTGTTTTTTVNQATTIGVGVGAAVGGAVLGAGVLFFVQRKRNTSSGDMFIAM